FAKSAIVSGAAMVYNPHGDAANYETMVRLTKGRESLLHPFVDSKGTFGKHYSDTPCAASRYTEVRLMKFCEEIFGGIDRDSVDFVPNFDNTETEPTILPVSFPNILVSPNSGIAVSLASNICSFNLGEICEVTAAYLKNPDITVDEVLDILKAPDFSTGGLLIYDREKLKEIYKTGKGSFKVRSKYSFDPSYNCIEVTEIPYTTTVEKIRDAIVALVKKGSVKDITDVRDEIDINGLKLTIDLKKGANPEKIMAKLFKSTPLEDSFPCNFNVLVGGVPRLLGVIDIIEEWCAFREECLRREFLFELNKKREKLHLLFGLREILLDIDKAIRIVRNTENDAEVVPNLMEGFGIDKVQAEYVAEIKLRNLNKQYILKRLEEIEDLEKRIAELNELLDSPKKIKKYIIKQLSKIKEKYAIPRRTFFLTDVEEYVETAEDIPSYPVVMFLSKEGYFKKCTPASLRGNDKQSYKEGDSLLFTRETTNRASLIFFTSKAQVYKSRM
ncbi:MAG: topoisomerase IV, partial [Clostridia bacterium]|nr:topoisomerase IV [Clostridia bacterium]